MARKRRRGEVVCRCGAYGFPHRMMGGACDGSTFVSQVFEDQMYGSCKGCHFVEDSERGRECQVIEGRDTCVQCPELQEYLRYNEIRLYGVNADAKIENPKRRKKVRR